MLLVSCVLDTEVHRVLEHKLLRFEGLRLVVVKLGNHGLFLRGQEVIIGFFQVIPS